MGSEADGFVCGRRTAGIIDRVNPSTSSARVLVEELSRRGVRHVVLAPGSRSAPLAHALASAAGRHDIDLYVRIDERVAAFTALGLARGGGSPAAVVTTSGTAAANLHPGVLEAAHAGVPLFVLTADRPHEMRGTGANQTTDQVRLFGAAPRFFADVPAASGRPDEDGDLRNLVARAVAAAIGVRNGMPGPVHLNLAFREPLVPDDEPATRSAGRAPRPGDPAGATRVDATAPGPPLILDSGPRTVVVAGDRAGPQARAIAESGGYPLLAEPSSGARGGAQAVGPYRLLLDRPEFGGQVERVVVCGHPTLSRPVGALLARPDVEVVVVAGRGSDWPDAARRADRVVSSVEVKADESAGGRDGDWPGRWRRAATAAQQALDGVLATGPLTGPAVAAQVWAARRAGEPLVVGSSNPIRDLDLVAAPSGDETPVLANRGLSGIDGTLSTASGVALASGRRTHVLLGDLAFLHDAGGLLTGPLERSPDLRVVVVNDDGGGIFSLLEHGEPAFSDGFERVFGTPHGADLAALCAGYGVSHTRVDDADALRRALADPPAGPSVLEVPAQRSQLRELHERLRWAVHSALDG